MSLDTMPPESFSPTDHIEFQDNRFASKVLYRDTRFNMLLFALQTDQEIPPHQTPNNAILQCLEGAVVVTIGQQPHTLLAHQLLHLPARITHGIVATENSKLLLIK